MIRIETLVAQFPALEARDVERWIALEWVRADRDAEAWIFREIDVARIELILDLRDRMEIDESAMPVVLSLLDQLFEARRRMRDLDDALAAIAPDEVRRALAERLTGRGS